MSGNHKPFICHQGKRRIKIVPRNHAGWVILLVWIAILAPMEAKYIFVLYRAQSISAVAIATVLFLFAVLVWGILMFRWLKARSEVIRTDK